MLDVEETRNLLDATPQPSSHDFFKHENESVDLLLKEMEADATAASNKLEAISANASPTKPLNFLNATTKFSTDPNSSSDTCTSEHDQQPANTKIAEVTQWRSSLSRNFDIEDSFEVQNTIAVAINNNNNNIINPIDDFQTSMTSTVDLKPTYINSSPSKSILKKSSKPSPKKVAFTATNPQVHHYPENANHFSEPFVPVKDDFDSQTPFNHQWPQPTRQDPEDENLNSTPPPPPPPHTSKPTFAELLRHNKIVDDVDDDIVNVVNNDDDDDDQTLADDTRRGKHENDALLSEKKELPSLSRDDELDTKLEELDEARKRKVSDSINSLSLSLHTTGQGLESPLNTLQKSPDVQLRSSGSSNSSLQSLKDDSRGLHSVPGSPTKINRGLSVTDGIRGLPDSVVESLLPRDESRENFAINDKKSRELQGGDDQIDSFDRSYNNTEQSILNLLNSASGSHLAFREDEKDNVPIKQEPGGEVEFEEQEPQEEAEDDSCQVHVKREPELQIKEEPSMRKSPTFTTQVFKSESNIYISESGLTPQEEVDHELARRGVTASAPREESDESRQEESKMSIRFETDSDWKLEDSNDGDREDNDEVSRVQDRSTFANDMGGDTYSEDAGAVLGTTDVPVELPLDSGHVVDADAGAVADAKDFESKGAEARVKPDENVLANSSNIAHTFSEDITLPPVERNDYSAFEELTRNMATEESSYERSLSAEHDVEKNSLLNFISIWHSQEKEKKRQVHKVPTTQLIAALNNDEKSPKSAMSTNQVRVPNGLNTKKFTEVNVLSRRIVSPDFDDINVSQFLPELSKDSGFADMHFSTYGNYGEPISSITKNVLSSLDRDPHVIEPPKAESNYYTGRRDEPKLDRGSTHLVTPAIFKSTATTVAKPSRFRVPTFEIKRSSSTLSPGNMYNDIFDDFVPTKRPTIRSEGIKTLPSMDKDDVKRILSARKGMTHDEYMNAKLVDQTYKKHSVVTEAEDSYDRIQQAASIHNADMESARSRQTSAVNRDKLLPRLHEDFLLDARDEYEEHHHQHHNLVSRSSSGAARTSARNSPLPDPHFDSSYSCDIDREKLSPSEQQELPCLVVDEPEQNKKMVESDARTSPARTPSPPKKGLIKIGSPVRLIKKDGSITGIESPVRNSRPQEVDATRLNKAKQPVAKSDISHSKIRGGKPLGNSAEDAGPSSAFSDTPPPATAAALAAPQSQQHHSSLHAPLADDEEEPDLTLQERGKVFFRVVGLKNIMLPDLKTQKGQFSISLDNGMHCVKTPDYDLLSPQIPIGKEFELTVSETLQFILTMKATYTKPKGTLVEVRERKVVKSKNRFSRLFGSKDIITTTKFVPSEVRDSWANKLANDGSFARCYVDLEQFESQITGRLRKFDLDCFNEWETTNDKVPVRRKPYKIASLEVEMLFVPRSDPREILPTSIRSAFSTLEELKKEADVSFEGFLHQEGGDCDIWKKRWFELHGISLVAHSEFSRKTRAKINLSKIVDVIYVDKENMAISKHRNFSDVLLVEHSFKIKFANGEIIEFGAPNQKEMKRWVEILENIVYRNGFRRQAWVMLMLRQQTI
ncbi:uncharacterized protein LODBEIA_P53170 [Lodderomyces beijingensis]|uniref:PH domain-containing protein n=1 Tax=Lodderomyces beijingensis TaxID=1775926 RepID=A0ABP0ZSI0_9ASCO